MFRRWALSVMFAVALPALANAQISIGVGFGGGGYYPGAYVAPRYVPRYVYPQPVYVRPRVIYRPAYRDRARYTRPRYQPPVAKVGRPKWKKTAVQKARRPATTIVRAPARRRPVLIAQPRVVQPVAVAPRPVAGIARMPAPNFGASTGGGPVGPTFRAPAPNFGAGTGGSQRHFYRVPSGR